MFSGGRLSKLVVLTKFSFPLDANIAKANLESVGIPSFIADEHTINMQWLYSDAMGGVRLLVAEEHFAEAKQIVSADFSSSVEAESECKAEYCHSCKSENVQPFTKGKRSAFVIFILLGFPLFFYEHGLKCNDCGSFKKT